ncbi:hypothetical protein CVN68_06135 [Sphingomonas psychrotolerans]|uniref:Uncharacterized protein n=1 Tax=Sphingomonas psychrotolerans TaxID=1327635 RepID=A0A2K8MK78_9SPHN|nr:hypothetical protein CVN68_06135 [Sphingomonas psychrotolerans]
MSRRTSRSGAGETAVGIFAEDAGVLRGCRKLGIARRNDTELAPLAVLGGYGFLRPSCGGCFGLNADAVERRGGCAGTLERFLRAA